MVYFSYVISWLIPCSMHYFKSHCLILDVSKCLLCIAFISVFLLADLTSESIFTEYIARFGVCFFFTCAVNRRPLFVDVWIRWQRLQQLASISERHTRVSGCSSMERWKSLPTTRATVQRPVMWRSQTRNVWSAMLPRTRWRMFTSVVGNCVWTNKLAISYIYIYIYIYI